MLLTDIAREAQVSPATVSRALNQPQIVATATLARIRAVMAHARYTPAEPHRRRGPKRSAQTRRRIGLWFDPSPSPAPGLAMVPDPLLHLLSTSAHDRIVLSILASTTPSKDLQSLVGEFDGLIIHSRRPGTSIPSIFEGLPRIWSPHRPPASIKADYIEPNHEENGHLAADYLARRGHKAVAALALPSATTGHSRRFNAFAARARELGLTFLPLIPPSDRSMPSHAPNASDFDPLIADLLAVSPRPTGLYLPADEVCVPFLRRLHQATPSRGRGFDVVVGDYNPLVLAGCDAPPTAIDSNLSTLL
ncbi:MAG: LacI family DNA-binding transcriptional regulator, partial [Verrucomicrobiota bacterium]